MIFTRKAGLTSLEATLTPRDPKDGILRRIIHKVEECEEASVSEGTALSWTAPEADIGESLIVVSVAGFEREDIRRCAESILRGISEVSGLHEAALEAKVERVRDPEAASGHAVERLESDLASRGIEAERRSLWGVAPGADVWAGGERGLYGEGWEVV